MTRPSDDIVPECTPTFTLDRQIARARAEMTLARWQQLNRDWNAKPEGNRHG